MTVELRTHAAIERAEAERERVERKIAAFGEFGERVREISTDDGRPSPGSSAGTTVSSTGSTLALGASADASGVGSTTADGTEAVREAFRETVLPHADADGLGTSLADELSPDIAAALSPAAGGFTPGLEERVVSTVENRRSECRLLADAIATERDRLREFAEELDAATRWLAEADETPLLQLGFEELRERHDRLDDLRATCDRLAGERQATIRGTQSEGLTGIRERELLDHLYADFEDDHPVLADVARLDDCLADCQRSVRRHLCARV